MISFDNQDLIRKHKNVLNLTQTDLASKNDFHKGTFFSEGGDMFVISTHR